MPKRGSVNTVTIAERAGRAYEDVDTEVQENDYVVQAGLKTVRQLFPQDAYFAHGRRPRA
jgi:ABC-type metal ion transport system substrate-binding protein